jgi:calcineurin-like phosphoesterase family protein
MIYYTADLHLGHENIIRHCNRPFSAVEEMDEHLISSWNSVVNPNDTVYILGDLIFRNKTPTEKYLSRLKGQKHLILGNHDRQWVKEADLGKYFKSVDKLDQITDRNQRIIVCHYPLMSWDQMGRGSYMVHGHIHNGRGAIYFPLLQQMPGLLNAGVDVNYFRLVMFPELVQNNEAFKKLENGPFAEVQEDDY